MIQINFGSAFLTAAANAQSAQAWKTVTETLEERGLAWDDAAVEAGLATYWRDHPPVPTSVRDVADHIDHVVSLVGVDHVGFGSDFDGVDQVPDGLEDVSAYPHLIAELLRRGYSEDDLRKICGENLLRVWDEVRHAPDPE